MHQIGITTTVPIEVLLAAGYSPLDLNNVFIGDPDPQRLVRLAEKAGFPQNCCTWIKGIYGVCVDRAIENVFCVTTGDCSNTIMLMEVLKLKGFRVFPFAYPDIPNAHRMAHALEALAQRLGTDLETAESVRAELLECRRLCHTLDELTWKEDLVGGGENHLWLVSSSDFEGDHRQYKVRLEEFIERSRSRSTFPGDMLRLAYIGVPPIFAPDLYSFLEQNGARVVFNEVQRQFSMPHHGSCLAEQYASYTYPYSIFDRVNDIIPELERRGVEGVIHYVQSFCHRAIGDIIFREKVKPPILTMEGNDSYVLTEHNRTQVEAFLAVLRHRRRLQQGRAPGKKKEGVT
ncbi:MAG: 2-hydroxyacyl-CoA dehydratase [Chloroflexota bacterium]